MSGYLLSIVGIVLITGMISAILPEGKTSGTVKTAARLLCLLVILAPVAEYWAKGGEGKEKIFFDFSDQAVIQTDESFIDYCSRKRVEEAEEYVRKETEKEYSVELVAKIVYECGEEGGIKILRIVLSDPSGEIDESKREEIAKNVRSKYGAEVVFA